MTLLHPSQHPHPAPLNTVPSRNCRDCGKVSGLNLGTHCCICGRPYEFEPSDRYSPEAIEQQRNAESRLP